MIIPTIPSSCSFKKKGERMARWKTEGNGEGEYDEEEEEEEEEE